MKVERFGFGAVNFKESKSAHGAFVLWNDYERLRASHEELYKAIRYVLEHPPRLPRNGQRAA